MLLLLHACQIWWCKLNTRHLNIKGIQKFEKRQTHFGIDKGPCMQLRKMIFLQRYVLVITSNLKGSPQLSQMRFVFGELKGNTVQRTVGHIVSRCSDNHYSVFLNILKIPLTEYHLDIIINMLTVIVICRKKSILQNFIKWARVLYQKFQTTKYQSLSKYHHSRQSILIKFVWRKKLQYFTRWG